MKVIGIMSATAVLLLAGTLAPVFGQREGGEKQEEKQPQQHAQPSHAQQPQQRAQQPQQRAQQPQRPVPQQRAAQPKQQEPQRAAQSRPQNKPQVQQRAQQAAPQQHAQQTRPTTQQARQAPQQARQAPQQAQLARQQPQPERTQQQARSWQQQKGWAQQGGGSQGHATFAQDRSQNWSSDHRTWAQRGGYGGYFIPQAQFNLSFGSQHFFRLGELPGMYLGYPRFSYGGFSFLMVDPWPSNWPGNWYSADDVYIGYNNGYYLYNRSYPQEPLAITIEL